MARKTELTRRQLADLSRSELDRLLSDREKCFVAEYLLDLNGTQAAVRAGYDPKNAASQASRLLRKPWVAEYRDRQVAEAFDAVGVTPALISMSCFEIYRRCMQKTPVQEWDSDTRAWTDSGEWQFDAKGALRALDQMAGLLGMKLGEKDDKKQQETVEQYLARTGDNRREF